MTEETKVAVINLETGLVENIAAVKDGDGSTAPDGVLFYPSDDAAIGDSWDGAQIVKAAPLEADLSADISEIGIGRVNAPTTSDRLDALEARMAAVEAKVGI